jgi:hypothetical protein
MRQSTKEKVAPAPPQSPAGATIAATITRVATLAVAALPLAPAVLINLDQAHGKGPALTAAAIGFVVAAAVAVEMARKVHGVAARALWCLVAILFLSLNIRNAIGNSAAHSDDARDVRLSQKQQSSRSSQLLSQLSQRRAAQAKVAGEDTPESIEAEIQAAKVEGSRKWNMSGGCDVAHMAGSSTRTFCEGIAKLQAKVAAAKKRDELDKEIAPLNANTGGDTVVPSSADPQAESLATFISAWGIKVGEDGKKIIASSQDWGIGIGVEVMAALLPSAIIAMLSEGDKPASIPEPKKVSRPKRKEPDAESTSESGDAEIDAFYARRLEPVQGEFISSRALYTVWLAYCEEHGIEPGSQKAFSRRIQNRVGYERNNGRPRYCHIRLREVSKPQFRVVSRGA